MPLYQKISDLTAGGAIDTGELYEIEKTASGSEGSYKRTYAELHGITIEESKSSPFTKGLTSKSILERIIFIYKSGTPTVKVGTSAGADDVVMETAISSSYVENIGSYLHFAPTYYIGISGGMVDVIFINPKISN